MKSSTVNYPARRTWRQFLAVVAALGLLAAACGGESNTPALTGDLDGPEPEVIVEDETEGDAGDEGGDEAMEQSEDEDSDEMRIVSLSATATEMLFAIGAGDLVVAADSYSNYPNDAPTTDLSAFEPNLEAIAAEDPTLVVLSFDPGDLVAGLDQLDIDTMVLPAAATIDDVYSQIADLGIATGNEDEAAEVNAEIRAGIDEIVAAAPESDTPVRVYHELDDTFFSATSSSFIGQLYALLGVENVADAADPDNESFGFPQLSAEYLIEADPQIIVITDQVGYSVDDVAARAGWDVLSAVQNDAVVQVDADVASRWGPRIVDFLQVISDVLEAQLVSS